MYALAMEKTSGHTSSFQEKINEVADKMDELAQNHFKVVRVTFFVEIACIEGLWAFWIYEILNLFVLNI